MSTDVNPINSSSEKSEPTALSPLIATEKTIEESSLRQIFIRAQMTDFVKNPLVMQRADGVRYWDIHGKSYLDALSGIYVVSVGHNNRQVIDAIKKQMDTLHFSPVMHGTNPFVIHPGNRLA